MITAYGTLAAVCFVCSIVVPGPMLKVSFNVSGWGFLITAQLMQLRKDIKGE